MERAIWTVFYDFPNEGRNEYLNWLHGKHLPQVLARTGYLWAAHYQIVPKAERSHPSIDRVGRSNDPAIPWDSGYALLIGAKSTDTFFDPSPTQLEKGYDQETRKIIGRRLGPVPYIHTVEWRVDGPDCDRKDPERKLGPVIQMGCFDATGQDEDLEAWYAQERLVGVSRTPGCMGGRKLLAATGGQRHGVLYDFGSLELRKNFLPLEETEWTSRVHKYLVHPQGSPFVGKRIWPPA